MIQYKSGRAILTRFYFRGVKIPRQGLISSGHDFFSTTTTKTPPIIDRFLPQNRNLKYKLIFISSFAVSGVILYNTNQSFHDTVRHGYFTIKRIGVVTVATIRCFYLYGKVLRFSNFTDESAKQAALSKTHKKAALITLRALEKNGGIYIKLGQHISAMSYLLPPEWTRTMIPLQDNCPESDYEEINNLFIEDLGFPIDELFEHFDRKPAGVASLAQVHIGFLKKTGEKVAVKCQHPSLKEFVPIDILMTQTVFKLMLNIFPEYPLTWLGEELQESIYVELDFNNEAKNAMKTASYFKKFTKQTALRIPQVKSSNKRILIMEYIGGHRLDDLEYLKKNNISRSQVSSCLSHIFNNMIFTPEVGVHCDPHGGNLAIRSSMPNPLNPHNFEIVLYDHGLYRNITQQMRRDYAKFWLAMFNHDLEGMRIHSKNFAGITDRQFPILCAAITGRDFKHALSGDVASARSSNEVDTMTNALINEGKIADLVTLLSSLPRVVLLILKTNDLTRHLDESLQNPLGPERTFLIMATYCAKTVYYEDIENNNKKTKKFGIYWFIGEFKAIWKYYRVIEKLYFYDLIMIFRNFFIYDKSSV
ncbi:hypothetical protein PACTADRAFT_36543 [Pachysolen tannophilus NRRL Y-2460]|uniref:ABC1 atypical kinase-like domain-containing protein n=1 Tax=Pachysolen tannophilus NRRL Y-2460 TaxID=669874 RepID=A0A1E4U3Q3_PACTA|nr:hypothetical protein PACTADRAFT_36543 [Pachysolen tannophilus NRRL Y-2460]